MPESRYRPLPPRITVSYPKAMTVCIAAVSRWMGTPERTFILCSDGRLSEGAWGSHDSGTKMYFLGYNFIALMAGAWDMVRDLCEYISDGIRVSAKPADKAALVDVIQKASDKFCGSIPCPKGKECDALITGFFEGPVMLRVTVKNKRCKIETKHDIDAIGEGSFAALTLLRHRGYDPLSIETERSCYAIYEAKKFSESVDSVGPLTRITFHLEHPNAEKDEMRYYALRSEAIASLETKRAQFFLQEVTGLTKFTAESFIN